MTFLCNTKTVSFLAFFSCTVLGHSTKRLLIAGINLAITESFLVCILIGQRFKNNDTNIYTCIWSLIAFDAEVQNIN